VTRASTTSQREAPPPARSSRPWEKFGTREKLIAAILDTEKRTKDEGYKSRLSAFPVPRLWDHFRTVEKRAKAQAAKKA
jgi:hypothetical protein